MSARLERFHNLFLSAPHVLKVHEPLAYVESAWKKKVTK
jgi:hypothetical protein